MAVAGVADVAEEGPNSRDCSIVRLFANCVIIVR